MTVSTETVRMAKSDQEQNQSKRSDYLKALMSYKNQGYFHFDEVPFSSYIF